MNYIGVLHPSMISVSGLKKHLIYFDKFHVPGLQMFKWSLRDNPTEYSDSCLADIDYLETQNAIEGIDIPIEEIDQLISNADILSREQVYEHDSYTVNKLKSPLAGQGVHAGLGVELDKCTFRDIKPDVFKGRLSASVHPLIGGDFGSIESDILSRAYSIRLNAKGVATTPILKKINYADSTKADRANVVSIIINAFPTPDEIVPFDEIFHFKRQNSGLRTGLRSWINKISSGESSAFEINEELETLLEKYSQEIKQYRAKVRLNMVETIVKVPFGVAENLLRMKFSNAIGALFSISHKRTELLAEEKLLEGREVGYIYHAKEKV